MTLDGSSGSQHGQPALRTPGACSRSYICCMMLPLELFPIKVISCCLRHVILLSNPFDAFALGIMAFGCCFVLATPPVEEESIAVVVYVVGTLPFTFFPLTAASVTVSLMSFTSLSTTLVNTKFPFP